MSDALAPSVRYVPTVRWLTGERHAFRKDVRSDVKAKIKPLIEIPPSLEKHDEPNEMDELMSAVTPEDFLRALPTNIIHSWGQSPFLLDTALAEQFYFGKDTMAHLCETLNEHGGAPIPVLRLDTPRAVVQGLQSHAKHGIALRLKALDLLQPEHVISVTDTAGAAPGATDIIVDLGYIAPAAINITAAFLRQPALLDFALSANWRSFTLLGGSFPPSLAGIKPGLNTAPRVEWNLWKDTIDLVGRRMLFGDYTVTYPTPEPSVAGEVRRAIPCIRYTDEREWQLFRGSKKSGAGGNKQYHVLAKQCRDHTSFRGREYSEGDCYIDNCASEKVGPGNPTTWRRVATSAHITYVAEQAASALGSAGEP